MSGTLPSEETGLVDSSSGSAADRRPAGPPPRADASSRLQRSAAALATPGIKDNLVFALLLLIALVITTAVTQLIEKRRDKDAIDRETWQRYHLSRFDHTAQLESRYVDLMARNRSYIQATTSELLILEAADELGLRDTLASSNLSYGRTYSEVSNSFENLKSKWRSEITHYRGVTTDLLSELSTIKNEWRRSSTIGSISYAELDLQVTRVELARAYADAASEMMSVWNDLNQLSVETCRKVSSDAEAVLERVKRAEETACEGFNDALLSDGGDDLKVEVAAQLQEATVRDESAESARGDFEALKKRLGGSPSAEDRLVIAYQIAGRIGQSADHLATKAITLTHESNDARIAWLFEAKRSGNRMVELNNPATTQLGNTGERGQRSEKSK